ncbi:shikimate dehydrogenase [Planktothrix sp. FACHB-1355]|uniref:Shikimate dehydrogenase (NADP(+)) n=1 Tax=Aerosakkonema funiforme FACHB-1375 TaxID=2949571 RepID=A0A926VK57_9CYAN|nr:MULTISPECIES: shikimate dehydrogenase [Oscillatoriales]MBD2184743.1 shikimate dehydrogenase [Aerosakkonema funiforme FACHB-1375]MBD3559990.1 shikimate dehydrogenase [Planktothrix sp. FACHB-1355]
MITGKTKLLGVIGNPIEHSLSPVMHNAAIATLGVDYVYLPFPVKPEDLQVAIAGFAAIGTIGFNVTIPHKQAIIPLLSEVSPIARSVGAVNSVWRTDKGWSGTNTDVEGFLAPLLNLSPSSQERDWSQTTALVLGYGGAARAVVAGCAQLGVQQVKVIGRSPQKLNDFLDSWLNSRLPVRLSVHNWQELPNLLSEANLLVNTTPIGMYPRVEESPLSADEIAKLPKGAIVYDLIYTPNPTLFLKLAKQQGADAIDGLEMLVQQGAAALQIWLQQSVPVDVMRQSLRRHLGLSD